MLKSNVSKSEKSSGHNINYRPNPVNVTCKELIEGYKCNPTYREGQLSKVLNLDSYNSYVSVIISYKDNFVLIDKVLPLAMSEFSKVFPFVVIRSAALNYIEIVFVSIHSIFEITTLLSNIETYLKSCFPGVCIL